MQIYKDEKLENPSNAIINPDSYFLEIFNVAILDHQILNHLVLCVLFGLIFTILALAAKFYSKYTCLTCGFLKNT